jgi:excisionase family DNA binding protein
MVGVVEAAEMLGVSDRRVRQMLADGVIAGERVGRAWVIDADQVWSAKAQLPEVGRPWNASSAWAVLALAGGEDPDLDPIERSRARKRLAQGLPAILGRLGARAQRRRFYAHPGVLGRLGEAPQVVRSGLSASVDHDADLVAGEGFEGYVRSSALDVLVVKFALDGDAPRPNVLLRVVHDAEWPFSQDQRVAPRAVVAVDLLDSDDPRARRAGAELAAGR